MFILLQLIHFAPPPRLLNFKNTKWLTYFCILLCTCYCFSHLIGLYPVTWLSILYKFTRSFIYFLFLPDGRPTLETWDFTICIGSTPTFLCFDLNLMFLTERQKVICLCNRLPTGKTCHGPNIFQHISIILFVCLRINEFNWQTFPRHSYSRHLGSSLGLGLRLSLIYLQCNNSSHIMHLQCQ